MKNDKLNMPLFVATTKSVALDGKEDGKAFYKPVVRVITDTGSVNFVVQDNTNVFGTEDGAVAAAQRVAAYAEKELRRILAREGYRAD